jgi:hypothetical protein
VNATSFQDVAALAVATADLKLVESVIKAMRAADRESRRGGVLAPEADILPRRHLTPDAEYLPRRAIHPTPRYLSRSVIHPTPKIQSECAPVPECPKLPSPAPSPIQPPWKQRVWQTPIPPRATLKVVEYRTDIPNKGSLLDVFI